MEITLIGNPNAGKTLFFNCLTGLRAKVANYPGVTVDIAKGQAVLPSGQSVTVVDLPGVYSLRPRSDDEKMAIKGLMGELKGCDKDRVVVAVVDATHLERNLYLVAQLLPFCHRFVVVLTMMDRVKAKGIQIDLPLLQQRLGVPICPINAKTGAGIQHFWHTIDALPKEQCCSFHAFQEENVAVVQDRFLQVDEWLKGVVTYPNSRESLTERIDQFLLHPVLGLAVLILVFGFLFQALFAWSEPAIGLIEFSKDSLAYWLKPLFSGYPLLGSLVVDGVIAGVGAVIAFVPLIAVLFLFLGILEDSGYLARATFLLDKGMSKVGLPGKAFVPLLSGFACAVPAILSTRVIESRRDRLLTMMVTPLMSCSARLPVYGLLIAAVFSGFPPLFGFLRVGVLIMFAMYMIGVVSAILMALALKGTILKGASSGLILELPPYRVPNWRSLFFHVWIKIKAFMVSAGSVILAFTIVLWALFTFPLPKSEQDYFTSAHLQNSFAAQMGHAIEPAIAPLGFDWKIGIGLVSSFAAREVMVSTLGVIYGLSTQEDETSTSLRQAMLQDKNPVTGKPVYTPLVAISLMAFFALSMQCMSTLAVTYKESGSLVWPVLQFFSMTMLAWVVSLGIYQGGRLFGWG